MEHSILADKILVEQYVNGNEKALEVLIARHKSKIFTSIYMFVQDHYVAEDLFQDAFIKAIIELRNRKYQEEGKFISWIMRIAHNLCIDYYRRTRRKPTISTSNDCDIFSILKFSTANPEDVIIRNEGHEKIRSILQRLPPEQREIVILRHWAGLNFKEVSELTQVCISTALGRMRYALLNMRKMLNELETNELKTAPTKHHISVKKQEKLSALV